MIVHLFFVVSLFHMCYFMAMDKHRDVTPQQNTFRHALGDALFALGTPYRWLVSKTTELANPILHRMTERYLEDAITRNQAEDNPRLQKLLKFEIERRAYGPGQTQDVAEPVIWIGAKIVLGLMIPVVCKAIEQTVDHGTRLTLSFLSKGAAIGVVIKESTELLRLSNRFIAGLQGSEKMALDREVAICATGIDPFGASVITPTKNIDSPAPPSTHIDTDSVHYASSTTPPHPITITR
ncbi:MAG: hypothetical protein EAZ74_04020 [Alphaproteobacteria bacterium]|nr:MAG: hypothetical protein EAY76_04015 [Alphaproteobacteria bacterium]TAF14404.1 MAG: hypothetical protein EAZ74_04020 [Alphaproteobacteria bacterium]TAF39565.1 MAG: hypothetical protein EAZ66_04570 [Alphaproteobacteria bacterium]TAF77548.1 MAG: hypothetical protein EAZ52_00150 [Alphaproteobacteria bacterium]